MTAVQAASAAEPNERTSVRLDDATFSVQLTRDPDGAQLVFNRMQENSDLVLIDRVRH